MSVQLSLKIDSNYYLNRFRGAFLGAAIGDALGFITEFMRSSDEIQSKFHLEKLDRFVDWERITKYYRSGRNYYTVSLPIPAGTYSDDTQLTLATARSIGADGSFDAEAFSMFELPLWLNYELGGGSGTKAAVRSLLSKDKHWYNNFYKTTYTSYIEGGGNGAAMRILPIALVNLENPERLYRDVWRNTIITHGHPRGLVGAILLADAVRLLLSNTVSNKSMWLNNLAKLCSQLYPSLPNLWKRDPFFIEWQENWRNLANQDFQDAWSLTCKDVNDGLELVRDSVQSSSIKAVLKKLGCYEKETKGAGHNTVIAAIFFVCKLTHSDTDASKFEDVVLSIVNEVGIDTDTIAYFAGAMLGSYYGIEGIPAHFQQNIQDRDYLMKLADWCYSTHSKEASKQPNFSYPSSNKELAKVKTILSNYSLEDKSISIPVFGTGKISSDADITPEWQGKHLHFRKIKLDFGQTIFTKVELPVESVSNNTSKTHHLSQSKALSALPALDKFKERLEKSNFAPDVLMEIFQEIKFERKDKAIYNAFSTWLWTALPNAQYNVQKR